MTQSQKLSNGFKEIGRGIKFGWEQYGSLICTIGGTAVLVGSGIRACRKTYKMHDFLAENGKKIEEAKKPVEGEKKITRVFRISKAVIGAGAKTTVKYLPEIAGAAIGTAGVGKGFSIERNHFKEAAAFGTMIFGQFMNYRKNVIAEHGVEADRKYLMTKIRDGKSADILDPNSDVKAGSGKNDDDSEIKILADPNILHIWYSKETTPNLWSSSHTVRMNNLEWATNELNRMLLQPNGHYSVNDARRLFYGREGDVSFGDIYGRVWENDDPAHPERARLTNLHYEDDEDFMMGRTNACMLTIEIDPEPIINRIGRRFTEVEC